MKKEIKMIDITSKKVVYREATAVGKIKLRRETIEKILKNEIEKGDVIIASKLVAISAAKKTSDLLPFCHPIPVTNVEVNISPKSDHLEVSVTVRASAKTGVEMEALTAVSIALLNIWDMVKKYEKDDQGQYPYTKIYDIRVISKIKRDVNEENSNC